jgi:hypothetical protein
MDGASGKGRTAGVEGATGISRQAADVERTREDIPQCGNAFQPNRKIPELYQHQGRQSIKPGSARSGNTHNLLLFHLRRFKDRGPNLLIRLGESRSYTVIKDIRRFLLSDLSRIRSQCFASMLCIFMKHVDKWKPD